MVKIGSSLVDTTTDALQKEIPWRKKKWPLFCLIKTRRQTRKRTSEKLRLPPLLKQSKVDVHHHLVKECICHVHKGQGKRGLLLEGRI